MMKSNLLLNRLLRAPSDDTASPLAPSVGITSTGSVDAPSGGAGVSTSVPHDFAVVSDLDAILDRLARVEADITTLKLNATPGVNAASTVGSVDAIKRIESVIAPFFDRQFAEYDAERAAKPAV